ncbi:MAG: hypothetical protein ACRD30_10055 [Bryobacteraceae bacterium]
MSIEQDILIVIAIFVFLAAVAMCIQAGLLFGMYKTAKRIEQRTTPLVPKVDALMETSRTVLDDSRKQIHDITVKTSEILESTRKQLARVDEVLEDATGRARIQLDRAEMVIDDTMNRAQETIALVHGGIMKPLREIQGLTAGLRAALNYLMRIRSNPVQATADEEMFI